MPYKTPEDRRQYLRQRREWLHAHHFCVDCKQQDAYTLVGHHRCFECHEKGRRNRGGHEIRRQDRVANGLCYYCGKPNPTELKVCEDCLPHYFAMSAKRHENHGKPKRTDHSKNPTSPRWLWVKEGFCYLCGDPREDKRVKVCEACRTRLTNQRHRQTELGQDELLRTKIDELWRSMTAARLSRAQARQERRLPRG